MRTHPAYIRLLSLSMMFSVSPSSAWAGQCAGVSLPDEVSIDGKPLVLNGMGLREATVLNIDVYVAGLYLERRSKDGKAIAASEQLKQLRLTLVRDVDTEDMRENLDRGFRRAAGQTYPKLAARFERLKSWIPDLKSGDKFIVTYRPNLGLEVRHGMKPLGSIDGPDFATTLFSIWLGDHPPNEGLKTGLLGGPCG
jgi:hypothetical protein